MFSGPVGEKLRRAILWTVSFLAVFIIIETIQTFAGLPYVGAGILPTNTITVSGTGDAYAVPDTGEFTYSVVSDKPTVAAAQTDAATKSNTITAYLKDAGVAEKDIRTTNYSIQPQYEWRTSACVNTVPCPPGGKQVLIGYEVRISSDVKVRDTTKAGDLLSGIGSRGASEVSGLSFTVADPTAVEAQARGKAIADAKAKANELARSLGVSLSRIVSFNENSGGYPGPMFYGKGGGMMAESSAVAPDISIGQNKVTSNVSITYEIR